MINKGAEMGYAKIACCNGCGKKRYVERINARWLCLDCQDVVTEEQPPETDILGGCGTLGSCEG